MKISELVGKTISLEVTQGNTIIAELKETRPVGFLFEVKHSELSSYLRGEHVFLSASCPFSFSTMKG